MQVFVCVHVCARGGLFAPFAGRLDGPRLPSQSSVTITGQRQQRLRAITEIARDDLECPPQHRENHFLTKRLPLGSAGPWQPTGRTTEPFFCLGRIQEWWTYTESGSESETPTEKEKLKRAKNMQCSESWEERDEKLAHLLMGCKGGRQWGEMDIK